MEARAMPLGHPVHQMLIVLPLGLLTGAIIFDIMQLTTDNGAWSDIAYWLMLVGVISGLVAAPFGLLDWTKIPDGTRAKRVGLVHGGGNPIVLLLFAASLVLRAANPRMPDLLAMVLSFAGGGLAMITGWLGGELVNRSAVGVADGAHPDAPSSLSSRPARSGRTSE